MGDEGRGGGGGQDEGVAVTKVRSAYPQDWQESRNERTTCLIESCCELLREATQILTEDEVENWKTDVRKLGAEPYVTSGRDVQSTFINATYLNKANPKAHLQSKDFAELIDKTIAAMKLETQTDHVNGSIDIARKKSLQVNAGMVSAEATIAIEANPRRYSGKPVLKRLPSEYQKKYGKNLITNEPSEILRDDWLAVVAQKAFSTSQKIRCGQTGL